MSDATVSLGSPIDATGGAAMTSIAAITLEVPDPDRAADFYASAFGLGDRLQVRRSDEPSTGFRGFTLSLIVAQPDNADLLLEAAIGAGAEVLKPAKKSLWGYGGVVSAPDGTIWKVATSAKKNSGPATRDVDQVVLLLGASDVAATKQFYVEHGFVVGKSFGRKYVEFEAPASAIKLGLYGRKALAKDAGVPIDGSGSHRIVISNNAGSFSDPDGFAWEAV